MTQKFELYRCKICSNLVDVAIAGEGSLVCCNENMEKLNENIPDIENAHYAFIENINDNEKKIIIKHVMNANHHIVFIEAISNDGKFLKRKYFNETEPCEMTLKYNYKEGFYIRLYCNLDGVWTTKNALGENDGK